MDRRANRATSELTPSHLGQFPAFHLAMAGSRASACLATPARAKPLGLGEEPGTRGEVSTPAVWGLCEYEHHLDGSVSGTAPEVDAEELVPRDMCDATVRELNVAKERILRATREQSPGKALVKGEVTEGKLLTSSSDPIASAQAAVEVAKVALGHGGGPFKTTADRLRPVMADLDVDVLDSDLNEGVMLIKEGRVLLVCMQHEGVQGMHRNAEKCSPHVRQCRSYQAPPKQGRSKSSTRDGVRTAGGNQAQNTQSAARSSCSQARRASHTPPSAGGR